jgi:hypothetical protein
MIPEGLLLLFFKNATSTLLHLKGGEVVKEHKDGIVYPLTACRRHVLNVQQNILEESLKEYQREKQEQHWKDVSVVTITKLRDCLGKLGKDHHASSAIQAAIESMNEAAQLALCKLILYTELYLAATNSNEEISKSSSLRCLQESRTEQGLDRTRLLEYFGLCRAALKLHCVKKFMAQGEPLFDDFPSPEHIATSDLGPPISDSVVDTTLLFPQTRLEYIQQLLAKAMGWHPVFLTTELQLIFVQRDDSIVLVHDEEVNLVFQELIQQMHISIRTASLQMQQDQQIQLLSDVESGGNTRVISVQYSEFDVFPDGSEVMTQSNPAAAAAPSASTMETSELMPVEERKRQIRMASEAAILQQEILGELLRLPEHERNNRLVEAERVSNHFMNEVIKLPPGPDRIDFLQSVDRRTSKYLAMHKLWRGILDANGGKPPQMAPECDH